MTEIRIDNTGDATAWMYNYSMNWKYYCGCENFNEEIVLAGNHRFYECTEAEWYQKAKEILEMIDNYDEFPEDLSEEENEKLKKMYESCKCTDDILVDVIRILYPDDTFLSGIIRGYSQGEWQKYIVKGYIDTELLEAMYFGQIADVTVTNDDEEYGDIITHDELWRNEREGKLKEYLRERYDISEDEELHIYQADGYKRIIDWKEV